MIGLLNCKFLRLRDTLIKAPYLGVLVGSLLSTVEDVLLGAPLVVALGVAGDLV